MTFFHEDEQLKKLGDRILAATWAEFPELARNQIALTWVVYDDPVSVNTGNALSPEAFWGLPVRGMHYRGLELIYPASVVKLFYLVAVHEWLETEMLQTSQELERAVQDMIVESSNDATSLVIDLLTGTTSGPELPAGPFATWQQQRNIVNRYFQTLQWPELKTININQKTWCDGPYGRERAFLGELYENRNMLTTNATARLLHSIVGGVAVSAARSQAMMDLLKRPLNPAEFTIQSEENQVTGFFGAALPQPAKQWSKAGWTSKVRHDAAYIEIPNQPPFLLVAFIDSPTYSGNQAILPFIAQQATATLPTIRK